MPYEPPGLDYEPDDAQLVGFSSLMPPTSPEAGLLTKLLRLPLLLLLLPLRVAKAILTAPFRLFRRGGGG